MKTLIVPTLLLVLGAGHHCHAAGHKYEKQVVKMRCGEASYTLTSVCSKSGDSMTLNDCKPQSLLIDGAGAKRTATLPELPADERKRMRASGRDIKTLFVVEWACSDTRRGPVATLYYSIGGGSAPDGETWTHYDKAGRLMESDVSLSPEEVSAVQRKFKRVPSIMPD